MRVLVIGSGLLGVATAHALARSGYAVTVLDRQSGPGRETSFANGALLHPSMPEPWNSPGCWRALLASVGRPNAALKLRLRALPGLLEWGAAFLRNSKADVFERNAFSNLRLASYSRDAMHCLRQETDIEYGRLARGSLRIFRDPASLDHAVAAASSWSSHGLKYRRLSSREVIEIEPALAPVQTELAGGIHYPADETGDAHRFCVELTDDAKRRGVEFHFGTEVSAIDVRSSQVTGISCAGRNIVADRYIVAAGSYSSVLVKSMGLRLPVYPAKGYSVTLDVRAGAPLSIPVIDDQLHAAVVPLAGSLRVAGTAEFAGYDLSVQPARIKNLLRLLGTVLPKVTFDRTNLRSWCGLRPMSADGVPLIGATNIGNLFLNTGHGHLGWTMAAGSAQLLCDVLSGRPPQIDPQPYCPRRFL